jgi:hypothetical protein
METNEYDAWRAGEMTEDDTYCWDCGAETATPLCPSCQAWYDAAAARDAQDEPPRGAKHHTGEQPCTPSR